MNDNRYECRLTEWCKKYQICPYIDQADCQFYQGYLATKEAIETTKQKIDRLMSVV